MKLKRILVPVDFSPESQLALNWAVKLAKEEKNAVVYLFHSFQPIPVVEEGLELSGVVAAEWDKAKANLEAWRKRIPRSLSSIAIEGKGMPVSEIPALCEKEKIDLVVMTTHGRHGLPRAIHPNLSERVVRSAPCPVLVLHLNRSTLKRAGRR